MIRAPAPGACRGVPVIPTPACLLALALLLLSPPLRAAAADEPFTFPSNSGLTGLMEVPTARVLPENRYRFGATLADPYRYYYGAIGLFPRLEVNGRITEIEDVPGFSDFSGYGDYKDKAFDIKLQLLTEGKYRPAVSLVIMDPHGTRIYAAQAIVASKQIYPFDVTLGVGNGRFGDRQLPESDESFKAELFTNFDAWRRDARLFGGIQFAPSERFALMAEYSPVQYHKQTRDPAQPRDFLEPVPSPWNVGVRLKPFRWAEIDASYQRGNRLAVGLSVTFALGNPLLPIYDAPYRERPEDEDLPASSRIARGLSESGFSDIVVARDGDDRSIAAQNDRYLFTPQAVAVAMDVLGQTLPEGVREVRLTIRENGIPLAGFTASDEAIAARRDGGAGPPLSGVTRLPAGEAGPVRGEAFGRRWYEYGLRPSFESFLNDPSGFYKYRLGLSGWVALHPFRGHSLVLGAEGYPVNTVSTANAPLSIPVRSDIALYKEEDVALGRLLAEQVHRAGDRVYLRAAAGLLEVEYAGFDAEVAIPLWDGRIFAGAGGSLVRKREPDRPFALIEDVSYHTAFLNGRLNIPEWNISIDVKAGRFLAGDAGGRLTVSKHVNGVVLSAWYSITDTDRFTDPFNRGYHDKGIAVDIPLRLFLGRESRSVSRIAVVPWTRDAGQDIDHYRTLFDLIGRNAGILLDKDREVLYTQPR